MQVTREVSDESEQVPVSSSTPPPDSTSITEAMVAEMEQNAEQPVQESIVVEINVSQSQSLSPFAKKPVKFTSKLTPDAPAFTPSSVMAYKSAPIQPVGNLQSQNNVPSEAANLQSSVSTVQDMFAANKPKNNVVPNELEQLTSMMQSLNQNSGQGASVQQAQDALALHQSQELSEALQQLDNNEQANFGKIDEAQLLASKLIGQLQDNTISNPALLLQHLLGFAPEDYNDLVTALSESGCNYIEIVAAYLHNIQVQAQENNGNNPGVAMAARQGVISKYNYLINELNKFKQMKDPATNLLNVAKHVQGQYDPSLQNLLQQRAAGYGQLQNSYSALTLPRQQQGLSPFAGRDPYSSLQQQLGASQFQSSTLPQSNRGGAGAGAGLNINQQLSSLGISLQDILQLEADPKQQEQLLQLLEAQQRQQLLSGASDNRAVDFNRQELGDQSKHLTSLGLQTMYGISRQGAGAGVGGGGVAGAGRGPGANSPKPPMWPYNSSMF
eukprot:TRINITY_DN3953_c1_g2_i1.p1 TRINITY_DN3953_c1_g2~~TRINITY_DN3953_c1_g2_i1.p1  ORF type:complete len:499 (+),score=75.07 TRINITY_DN3953_c1_g2_i1:176-1672(+)